MEMTETEMQTFRTLDSSYKKDINLVKIHSGNTEIHELAKCRICYFLRKENRKFVTEAIFKGGGRADIICLSSGVAYEILHSETLQDFTKKIDKYPVTVRPMMADEVLNLYPETLIKLLS